MGCRPTQRPRARAAISSNESPATSASGRALQPRRRISTRHSNQARAKVNTTATTAVSGLPIDGHRAWQDRHGGRRIDDPKPAEQVGKERAAEEGQRAAERPQPPSVQPEPRRRRMRASPSTAATSTGSISAIASRRTAQAGSVWRCSSTLRCIAGETSGAVSSASTALSTARPKPCSRSLLSRLAGARPTFAADLHEHGRACPCASSTPCSPTASGNIRWASCPSALGAPGLRPASWVIASVTVRCSCSGAEPRPSEKGTTEGRRRR